ncbi:hypothetical protein NGC85_08370 [Acinetobacter sp. Z1]|uniref:hypothetical protein n=1 Tax=Acinetobacter sp. Z1 TaxID=2953738 RepID=UPI0020C929BC|nr:hypothetical protein [Acinetobacter sp. Z1]UTO17986.1 hypothetical protein NGC85_08370 [Acinetobacter sp. Z1]
MQFNTQLVVLGAKSSKGEYNGRPFNSTTVFYQAQLQEGENFAGQVGSEYKWGTSDNFEKIKNQKFPFMADCTLEQVSNGKTTVTILKELKPVPQPAK